MNQHIEIEVVYALPGKQIVRHVHVPAGTTAEQAVRFSTGSKSTGPWRSIPRKRADGAQKKPLRFDGNPASAEQPEPICPDLSR